MIITVGGRAGAGKSTISKLLAKKLDLTHYSTGDLMRMMAVERGISLLELSRIAEKDKSIDKELDQRQIELGKKHDNFVIDGRLAAFFIPNSIKIFLDADKKERARRIIRDKRKEETSDSVAGMVKELHVRELSEKRRYHKYYGFDCYNTKFYEIVVDTTHTTKEETVSKVINKMKESYL
jgi:cytidylate kinase